MNVSARLSPAAIPPNPAPRYGRPTDDNEQEAALTGTLDESSTINREGAPAKVFRTEMNPVDLLARAASVYAEKVPSSTAIAATPMPSSASAPGASPTGSVLPVSREATG